MHGRREYIECFIEDQAFSPSYDYLDRRYTGRLGKRDNLLTGELVERGEEEETNYTTARKSGPL
jgi:hypothetical protein